MAWTIGSFSNTTWREMQIFLPVIASAGGLYRYCGTAPRPGGGLHLRSSNFAARDRGHRRHSRPMRRYSGPAPGRHSMVLPLNAVTALIGSPVIIWFIVKRQRSFV